MFGFRSHRRCQGEVEELHKQALPRLQPHYRDRVPHHSFPGPLQCKGLSPCSETPKGVTVTGTGVKSFTPGLAAGYGGGADIAGGVGVGTGTDQGTWERDSSWAVRGDNALPMT